MKKTGAIAYYLRQVPIYIPSGTYRCDFLVFGNVSYGPGDRNSSIEEQYAENLVGAHRYVDTKGIQTKEFKMKMREIEVIHPQIKVHVVTRADIDASYIRTVKEIIAHADS